MHTNNFFNVNVCLCMCMCTLMNKTVIDMSIYRYAFLVMVAKHQRLHNYRMFGNGRHARAHATQTHDESILGGAARRDRKELWYCVCVWCEYGGRTIACL